MAEVVEYRLEKSIDELELLVEFGLLEKEHAKEILSKRENYEYCLRKRTRTPLDYLNYIKFEVNLLNSIEQYRKSVTKQYYEIREKDNLEELEFRILLLQAKKLKDVINSRCAHISSLFRKLTTSFQFDTKLWLAYIEFAKSRKWYSRTTAIYWRLLRIASDDPKIWLAAAEHEVNINKTYDVARGLYLRALRHHPKSAEVWAQYFIMELKFMEIVDRRARIVFKITQKTKDQEAKKDEEEDIWQEKDIEREEAPKEQAITPEEEDELKTKEEAVPHTNLIEEDDAIISGHLPKVIYDKATSALEEEGDFLDFIIAILTNLLSKNEETKGVISVKNHIANDLSKKREHGDLRVSERLLADCDNLENLKAFAQTLSGDHENVGKTKKLKKSPLAKIEFLYNTYDKDGLESTRNLFEELEKSVRNQTLSLYVGMIQVESWQLMKDKTLEQLNRMRTLYDKALSKFGKSKPKLWYEYLQFEQDNAKTLEDFERVNQIYVRAQSTLEASKVDRVIEKYTLIQAKRSSADIEHSDYSDLDD